MELQANTSVDSYKSDVKENMGPYLVWEDLTVMAKNLSNGATRKLLSELSGHAEPDRIMAIMGPSGSGKSTLLDSLAGRLSTNVMMSGNVLLNGKKRGVDCRDVSYVTQQDVFLGTLTVRETLTYSAHLRLPTTMTKDEMNEVVEDTISKMGLQDCADNTIGNWHLKGISGGEKRRLSISVEILTQPHVLCLDEPTSGLDSASAFFVIQALRNIAHDGKIVICSVHQPSIDVFDVFDDLFLLSNGETVYFGEVKMALKFFADAGFPCPTRRNPPDHFLRCITSDFDQIMATLMQTQKNLGIQTSSDSSMNLTTAEIKATLVKRYKCSEYSKNARKRIREITLIEERDSELNTRNPSWLKQLCTLTRRSSLNMSRDVGYYWLRVIFYILVSVTAGTFYYNIGTTNQAILSRGKCDGFIYGLMICLCVGGIPFFIEEVKVFHGERFGGHYGEAVYVISNFLSSLPFVVAISLSSGTILYYMVNFHPGFSVSHYSYFCLNLFCCIAVTEGSMFVFATLLQNPLMAIGVSTGVAVFMLMPSSLVRPLSDIPKFFWRYPVSYISYAAWAIQGQYKNDMIGLEFDPVAPGQPKLKGEIILQVTFGISLDHSKWWDLSALLCLLIANKLLLFITLRYKDRTSSLFRRLCAKNPFQRLGSKPSLRRI